MLRIKGIITKHGERCQIHIQSGAALSPRDDVTLHISIRPNEYAIVRNTIKNQVVGPEERHGGCPVRYGEPFDLLILAEGGQYKIAFNGVHFCTFAHRLPLHLGRYIAISGGCVIYSILSEHDQPGSSSYQPNMPSSYPHSIGFAPPPPPMMPMAPPPPYTPLPTHPIGGGGGHYKDLYPPPPPPPMAGYPHHPAPYQPAVPFSKGKQKKLLKYGAAAGLAGLGGYALAKGIRRKGSSSSSSDSD